MSITPSLDELFNLIVMQTIQFIGCFLDRPFLVECNFPIVFALCSLQKAPKAFSPTRTLVLQ